MGNKAILGRKGVCSMKRKNSIPLFVIAVLGLLTGIGGCSSAPAPDSPAQAPSGNQGISIDQAIREAALNIENKLEKGIKIAALNFSSSSDGLSEYVLEELSGYLVNGGKLIVLTRTELDSIRAELDFNLSDEVADKSAQEAGRMLGAQYIVSGSIQDLGDVFRIRLNAIAVENGSIGASYSASIVQDSQIQALLASGGSARKATGQKVATQGKSGAQGGGSSSASNGANSGGNSGSALAATVSPAAASNPAAPSTVSAAPVSVVSPSAVPVVEAPMSTSSSSPENYRVLKTINAKAKIGALDYSPDASRIAAGMSSDLIIFNAQTGIEYKTVNMGSYAFSSMDYSPDSKRILTSSTGGYGMRVWDIASGSYRDLSALIDNSGYYSHDHAAYSPDGKRIAYGSYVVNLCDANNGQEIWKGPYNTKLLYSLVWNPDGSQIAFTSADSDIKILNADTGQVIRTIRSNDSNLTWSPQGKHLASYSRRDISIWDVETGKLVWKLGGHGSDVTALVFSPDGRRVVSGSLDAIKVWDVESGWEIKTLAGFNGTVTALSYSPNGRSFVSGSYTGSMATPYVFTITIWGE
jgi:WD40 repeat protein